eukprot:3496236-Amphidinium_carterae.2
MSSQTPIDAAALRVRTASKPINFQRSLHVPQIDQVRTHIQDMCTRGGHTVTNVRSNANTLMQQDFKSEQ